MNELNIVIIIAVLLCVRLGIRLIQKYPKSED
ncbi:hypothetical protein C8N46_11121 [Kordia periserrulae]|uniref:Uncharacterized protein n=1 Tax=Kordia periserrulae TaxID=701523 RepID=A0A2T6BSA8_9FLAO|nr:hypothetical protein C8N46_11121 [Kordia periserrulae]